MIRNEIKLFSMSAEGYDSVSCSAPCTLLSVLLDGGYIDDPLFADNIEKVKAKLPRSCKFSADIEISGDALYRKHVYIRLRGIYAAGEVFFNGRSYGMVYDPNRIYLFDVTDRIMESDNKLEIVCTEPTPELIPIERDGSVSKKYTQMPYLGDMGITGKCEVIFTNRGFIGDVCVKQEHKGDSVDLFVSADVIEASKSARLVATVVAPSGKLFYGVMAGGECKVSIKNPEYWMPNGLGNPSLYKLSLTLYEDEEASDTYERKIGLREVEISMNDAGCPSLKISGNPVFPLGATYITADPVLPRITPASLEKLIKGVAASGMNTLRVVSGGICPPDAFYDLCDKYGIMVFNDVAIPYHKSFATSRRAGEISDGVLDVLAKISSHPCTVCAELSLYEQRGKDKPGSDFESEEFFGVLRKLISEKAEKYTSGMCLSLYSEDIEKYDERYYKKNQKSLIALPVESSLESFLDIGDMNILSKGMRLHGLDDVSASKMLSEMVCVSKFPTGIPETVYATNITAYKLFSDSVKAVRAEKFENGCSGAICRQLNDPWPAVSSSFTDWYGEKKALSFAAKDAFSPVTVYGRFDGDFANLTVINESKKTYEGKLMAALYTTADVCLFESVRDVTVRPGESILSVSEDFSKFISKEGRDKLYMTYVLSDVKGVYTKGNVCTLPLRDMALCDPKIEALVEGSGKNFIVKLTSSAFSPNVRIDFEKRHLILSDNYFDIASYAPVMIRAQSDDVYTPEELMARLKIYTVYDMGKEKQ